MLVERYSSTALYTLTSSLSTPSRSVCRLARRVRCPFYLLWLCLARASLEVVAASFTYELVCHVAACVCLSLGRVSMVCDLDFGTAIFNFCQSWVVLLEFYFLRTRLVAKSLWCKTRPKLPKSLSRPARHYLLKKSDVEHPFFKRSPHTQGPPACGASFSGP